MTYLKSFEKEVEKREKIKKVIIGTQIFERVGHIVYVHQRNYPKKIITLEKLTRISKGVDELKKGDVEYRISYFICINLKNNKWKRSAFHPLVPDRDLGELFKKAKTDKDFSDFILELKNAIN